MGQCFGTYDPARADFILAAYMTVFCLFPFPPTSAYHYCLLLHGRCQEMQGLVWPPQGHPDWVPAIALLLLD